MDEEQLAELRAQHAHVTAMRRGGEIVAVFRNIKFDELLPLWESDGNPALRDKKLADTCLLFPTAEAFSALIRQKPTALARIRSEIQEISGGQCILEQDTAAKTWSAFIPTPTDEDPTAKRHLLTCKKLEWAEHQRWTEQLKGNKLEAYRSGCMAAAVDPKGESAKKLFDDLPYLAQIMMGCVYQLGGAEEFDFSGN